MESHFFIVVLMMILFEETDAAKEAIILTTVPKFAGFPDTHHMVMIPGTPYDLMRNETMYQHEAAFSSQPFSRFQSCDVDYSRSKLYMYDKRYSEIVAISNIDPETGFANSQTSKLHVGVSRGDVKIAVDWVSHNIYWTDPMFRQIVMQRTEPNLDNTSLYRVIVKEDLDRPYGLAVDPVGGYLFWSDISTYPNIERASLSGENRKVIISTNLLLPTAIDVDISDVYVRRIYWVDAERFTIETADLEGGDRKIVRRISHTQFYDIAVFRYVLSIVNTEIRYRAVHFLNKTSGDMVANPYTRQQETVYGICLYSQEVQPIMQDHCAEANCSDLCVNEGGKAKCLCREGSKLIDAFRCTEDTGAYHRGIVFSDDQGIYVTDMRVLTSEFSNFDYKTIYPSNSGANVSKVGEIQFMAVDAVDRKVIFVANGSDIYSMKIDVTNTEPKHVISVVNHTELITGLSLDWRDKNIYWTSGASRGSINVISQITGTMFTLLSDLDHPRGIKLLPLEMKIIWISGIGFNTSIEISNMDGTDRQTLLAGAQHADPRSLDYDPRSNRLIWVDNGRITSMKLDRTELNILPVSARQPELVLVYKDYLVWTEDTSIYTASLQQPSTNIISDSLGGISKITAIQVLDEVSQPPQKGPCDDANGGCEHICIPLGFNRICECEYGFTRESNGRSCSSEPLTDNFLLVTDWSHNKLYQVSLDTDDVRAVDIQITGNPNAVVYNPFTERVIWGDTLDEKIRSVFLNGSSPNDLVYNGAYDAYADRFAVDGSSGNVYFTSVNLTASGFVGVGIISPLGDVLNLVTGGDRPRDIVLDVEEGFMFWTEHGNVPSVKKAFMDGSSVSVIISKDIYWPNGLAIDYKDKLLFISDGFHNTIQSCDYNGTCTIIHTDPGAHLMDIELSGIYLYYTAWNRPYITKMNRIYTSYVTKIASDAHLGRLDSISIYRSADPIPENEHCAPNNGLGDCSTYCLPRSNGYRCACQNGVNIGSDNKFCEDVDMCPKDLLHITVSDSCTFKHGTNCSYTCSKFYIPASEDSTILCLYGEWSHRTPCVFSTVKCPEEVTDVLFNRTCTYENGRNCTYRCPHTHLPTSEGGVMACNNGVWDNPDPCREKVPHCPTEVDNVRFYRTCTYQNGEVCNFSCQNGLVPVPISSSMLCTNGSWEFETPCIASSSTSPAGSSTPQFHSSTETSTESGTSSFGQQQSNVVPIAVGVSVSVVVVAIVVVVMFVFICKRRTIGPLVPIVRRNRDEDGSPFRQFHSPYYQGFENASTTSGVPSTLDGHQRPDTTYDQINNPQPDTTYDLITFDQPGASSTDSVSSSSFGKQFPIDTAVEYRTFGGSDHSEPSIYLHPASERPASERRQRRSNAVDSKSSSSTGIRFPNDTPTEDRAFGDAGTKDNGIYLHPVSDQRDSENFM